MHSMIVPDTLSPTAPPPPTPVAPDVFWRWSVEQYHEMLRAGILMDGDPVELLEGWLITKMSKSPSHSGVNRLLSRRVEAIVPPGWHVITQDPITLDTSEPEPDTAVVRGQIQDHAARHPGPGEVGLLVEVADSSLTRDRGWKKRIYARARIPVYWIVNLVDCQVEVYTQPSGPAEQPDYAQRQELGLDDSVPVILDGQEVGRLAVRDFLG
jgi:Uma2 family endonuclease